MSASEITVSDLTEGTNTANVETISYVNSALNKTVNRQVVAVGGTAEGQLTAVKNVLPAYTDYGLCVRIISDNTQLHGMKADIFKQSVIANTPILSTDLTPTNAYERLYIQFNASVPTRLILIEKVGSNSEEKYLYEGKLVPENTLIKDSIILRSGATYNFKVEEDCVVSLLLTEKES